jgi:hypothetical protein
LEPDKPVGHIRAIWALTLILAFTIVIVGGVYFILWYSPWGEDASWHRTGKTADTSDWQTYTDWNYVVSFKYPKDWENKSFASNIKGVTFFNQSEKDDVNKAQWTSLTQYPGDIAYYVDPNASLEQTLAKFKTDNPNCEVADKKIANLDGKALQCPLTGENKNIWYYLVGKTTTTFYLFTSKEDQKGTLDKMIDTFSFSQGTKTSTSPKSSVKTKTFTNQDLVKFSFDYPEKFYVFPDFQEYGGTVKLLKKEDNNNTMSWTKVEVKISYLASKTTDIRLAYKEINKSDIPEGGISTVTEATVGGVPALKQTYTDLGDMGYFLIKNDYLIEISAFTSRIGDEKPVFSDSEVKTAFESIVSSWQFT